MSGFDDRPKGDASSEDRLAERALDVLSPAEAAEVDARATASVAMRATLDGLRAAASQWPERLTPQPASLAGKRRLLAALDGPEQYRPFFSLLRTTFDLEDDQLLPLLAKVGDESSWRAFVPSLRFFDFRPGPAVGLPEGGFLRLAAGATFPRHKHVGREIAVILQGSLLLEGRAFYPGDLIDAASGTAHSFAAGPGRDLILMVAHGGLSFDF